MHGDTRNQLSARESTACHVWLDQYDNKRLLGMLSDVRQMLYLQKWWGGISHSGTGTYMSRVILKILALLRRKIVNSIFRITFPIRARKFQSELSDIFNSKHVALIGGAPEHTSPSVDQAIHSHDLVVRVNMPRNLDGGIFQRRVDVVFLGANVSDPQYLRELSSKIQSETKIISTSKNKGKLTFLEETHFVCYFPKDLPIFVSNKACRLTNYFIKTGVPRSGFICLASLLFYGKPQKVSIFGMSKEVDEAYQTVGKSGEVITYDRKELLKAHCDPAEEIKLMDLFVSRSANAAEWIG